VRSLALYSRRRARSQLAPEAALQVTVVEALRLLGVPGLLYFRVPNDGKRTAAAGLWEKRMGLLPGVADLVILLPGKPVLFLELKARGERQSPEQIGFASACRDVGAVYALADTIDDALAILAMNGAITRRAQRAA
jgi:hypothetical protein